ncbi:AlwI family type II restriction endonuclease [Sulfurimonas lithotrophica]|uniref:AlwI family type II restriction endonuclease n=1 Tax=Sulfurimonas lithotrophica TaxID=2590022 RepID=A0A5P8P3F9_9BACT|nr:AlwI family type II restriction endonuclease [Sulfurimonas lithotrophica]QFR50215.1 AlwI family type II restriction endonuclease [Sulfurimonas lithotrophica]
MKKVWSISTTLRNPERLRNFLITLKEMQGCIWNKDAQLEFQIRLIKNRYYGYGNTQFYNGLSSEHIDLLEDINKKISMEDAKDIFESKNYVGASMRGRNSYKTLEKMGLATIKDRKIKITSLGEYLLSDNYDLGELFFRSFLKWQYPNPVDREFSDNTIYDLKPFILTLHLIKRVNELCSEKGLKEKGISRVEFEIFAQTLTHYKELDSQAEQLLEFRQRTESIKEYKLKKEFIEAFKEQFLYDFVNIENLSDYADNTIRYFRLTRLIYIRGGGYYIDLEPRRKVEIETLLKTYDGSAEKFTKDEYIDYISNINLPQLPWENAKNLNEIYNDLVRDIDKIFRENNLSKKSHTLFLASVKLREPSLTLKQFEEQEINRLREYRKLLLKQVLKIQLQDISKIDETIDSLKNIRTLDLKPSIALEKYITMALNIINDAKEIKPNSLLGDDGDFIFTAPANKPDIECYYESFNSICEVTMLTGRDQWHNEGQPVMRHFRDFEDKSSKENYCIFVAPQMHRDTINTFWFSLKYEYEGKKQKIIPLTITQIIDILEYIKLLKEDNKGFVHIRFQSFLESVVELKDDENINSSDEWLRAIPNIVKNFTDGKL